MIQNRLVNSPTWQSLGKIRSPYKHLEAFTEDDADNFYGREEIVDRVAELAAREPLVRIVGASGSGKSSLVQAGLIPKLRQDPKCKWQILTMRPGQKPFAALAQAIAEVDRPDIDLESDLDLRTQKIELDIDLESNKDLLTKKLPDIRTPDKDRVLLFIDQFEELFTQVTDLTIRQKFLASLADAVRNAPYFTLVFTLRDDFSPKLQNNVDDDDFRPLLERYRPQELVGMTRDRLRAAIIEPVAKLNVEFEKRLVDRLISDVGNDAGNLPLLQMVLDLLWQHQQPRLLTHNAYDTICGEQGLKIVLANLADKIYDGYVRQDKIKEFKQVLLSLVTLGDDKTANTRQTATYADIGEYNWQEIVVPLSTERLLKTDRDKTTNEQTVEIVHETLIQSWQKLAGWIEDYRHELERIREIESAAIKWDRNKRSKVDLWGGKKLKEARKFSQNRSRFLKLKPIVSDFLVAGGKQQRWNIGRFIALGMIVPGIFVGLAARDSQINSAILTINNASTYECTQDFLKAIDVLRVMRYDLGKLDLKSKNFTCTNLPNINFQGTQLERANFRGVNLEGANFQNAHISDTYFEHANLKNANFESVYIEKRTANEIIIISSFRSANLEGAHLKGTNFHTVDFDDANFEGADLRGTILQGAYLKGANLRNADLEGADFTTYKDRGNTRPTQITPNQVKLAKNWQSAKYDPEFRGRLGLE